MSTDRSLPSWSVSRLVVVALLAVVVLSGCTALSGDQSSLPDGETAADAYRSLDGYTATVQIEQSEGQDTKLRLFVDVDGNQSRTKYMAPPSKNNSFVVYNGSSIVQYNASRNEYAVVSVAGRNPSDRGAQHIEDAVENARQGGATTDGPPVGGAPLPVVPESESDSTNASQQFTVSYDGTETVLGREAHVIRYEAAGDRTDGVITQTVWMDAEHFITLKATQEARFDGKLSTYSFEMTEVTFDPDFEEGRFAFDPPPGATLNHSQSFATRSFETRETLAETTSMAVPNPAMPDGFELTTANGIDGQNFTAVELVYRDGTSSVIVTKTTERSAVDLSEGESVTVGEETGVYRSVGTEAIVGWECDGTLYVVKGTLQRSTLLDIAQSIECE